MYRQYQYNLYFITPFIFVPGLGSELDIHDINEQQQIKKSIFFILYFSSFFSFFSYFCLLSPENYTHAVRNMKQKCYWFLWIVIAPTLNFVIFITIRNLWNIKNIYFLYIFLSCLPFFCCSSYIAFLSFYLEG
jgi:hypothetical protein